MKKQDMKKLKTQCVLCKSNNIEARKQNDGDYYKCINCGAEYFIKQIPADIKATISFTNFPKQYDPYKNEVIIDE